MRPKRIQRKRTAGWKNTDNAIYVGRPTKWGNPFEVGRKVYREGIGYCEILNKKEAVSLYEIWMGTNPELMVAAHKELNGLNLSCWCKEGEPCHADILLKIANE